MKSFLFAFLAICFLSAAFCQNSLNVGTFAGGLTLPISQTQGFLAAFNVSVNVSSISSSVSGYAALAAGQTDLVIGATDNIFSRYYDYADYHQNVTLIAANGESNLQIIAASRYVNTWQDYRNTTIVVDSPTSGLVLSFRRALAIRNLWFERGDYNFLAVGVSLSRFQAIDQGWFVVNGTNFTNIGGGVLATPYSANVLTNSSYYGGNVKALSTINNEILPIDGSSYESTPQAIANPNKAEAMARFIAAEIIAKRFIAQPQNKPTVVAQITSTTYPPAVELIYQAAIDPVVGEIDTNLTFNEIGLKNAIFLKEVFGGFPYNDTDYENAFTYGTGQLVDYSVLNVANAKVAAFLARFKVNNYGTGNLTRCGWVQNGKTGVLTINNFVRAVINETAGACTGLVQGSFVSCTSDAYAAPIQCTYNATTDSLSVVILAYPGSTNRTYNAVVQVNDLCGSSALVNRVIIASQANTRPSACTAVTPL